MAQVIASRQAAGGGAQAGGLRRLLSFYRQAPQGDMVLEELESCSLNRLLALHKIGEDASLRAKSGKAEREAGEEELRKEVSRLVPLSSESDARRDAASHHLLRLAFCLTRENREWFVKQEVALFKLRFKDLSPSELSSFLRENDVVFPPLSDSEADRLRPLVQAVYASSASRAEAEARTRGALFLVPFEEVVEQVRQRSVLLVSGNAVVDLKGLNSVVFRRLRAMLSEALNISSRAHSFLVPQLERMASVMAFAARRISPGSAVNPSAFFGQSASLGDIETLCEKSYPLCMRRLHQQFCREDHLYFNGRLQYGLFLKGLGLSLEDAQTMFTDKFGRHVGHVDSKLRPYVYAIRHMYGKEGKGADYTPYGCVKIIMGEPKQGDCSGCPFNVLHLSEESLTKELQGLGLSSEDLKEVMLLVRDGHPQLACGRVFRARHPGSAEVGINHPNQYASYSRKYWADKLAAAPPPVKN